LSSISVPAQIPSQVLSTPKKRAAKLTLWPLVAATFFMVSGGTYGTEEIIHGAGYGLGILVLLFLPALWSLPTAFMIGELSSALPQEGGYYAWVRRGLGNFWGFQEAWLSLVASVFRHGHLPDSVRDLFEADGAVVWWNNHGILAGLFVVVTCAGLNIAGFAWWESLRCGCSFFCRLRLRLLFCSRHLKWGVCGANTQPQRVQDWGY